MKKTFKVLIILGLVFTLLSSNISVLAENIVNEVENQKEANIEKMTNEENTNTIVENNSNTETQNLENEENKNPIKQYTTNQIQTKSEPLNTSKLFIKIDLRLPEQNPNFNITLQHKGKMAQEKMTENTVSEDGKELYYTFDNLTEGDYSLKINSLNNSYLPYSQEFKVEAGKIIELNLTNGHDTTVVDSNANKIVGVMGIGDVSQNDVIDAEDVKAMIEQIEKLEYSKHYDLNNDGKVNIIDLSYVMFNRKNNTEAKLLQLLNVSAQPNVGQDTTLKSEKPENGTIEDILKNNDKYVTLAPSDGEDISKDNAVEITLDLPKTDTLRSNYNCTINKSRK